jgi:flagellar hook-length control protein FliK
MAWLAALEDLFAIVALDTNLEEAVLERLAAAWSAGLGGQPPPLLLDPPAVAARLAPRQEPVQAKEEAPPVVESRSVTVPHTVVPLWNRAAAPAAEEAAREPAARPPTLPATEARPLAPPALEVFALRAVLPKPSGPAPAAPAPPVQAAEAASEPVPSALRHPVVETVNLQSSARPLTAARPAATASTAPDADAGPRLPASGARFLSASVGSDHFELRQPDRPGSPPEAPPPSRSTPEAPGHVEARGPAPRLPSAAPAVPAAPPARWAAEAPPPVLPRVVATDEPVPRSERFEITPLRAAPGTSELQLLVRPESLGRVTVRLIERGGVVDIAVRSETSAARAVLAESLPSLLEGLEQRGWQIDRLGATNQSALDWWTAGHHRRGQPPAREHQPPPRRSGRTFSLDLEASSEQL